MTFEDLESIWSADAHIDKMKLDDEALKIPKLHAKYYEFFWNEKKILLALKDNLQQLEHVLEMYYSNTLTMEELEHYKLVALDKKILKNDVPKWIGANNEVMELKRKIAVQNEKIDFIKSILQQIGGRSFIIKDAIAFRKFTEGEF